MLLDGSARIAIDFENYETEERVIIVRHVRSMLLPEVQRAGTCSRTRCAARAAIGSVEARSWRDLFPTAAMGPIPPAIAGGGGSRGNCRVGRNLGQPGFLAVPLFPLAAWALMRTTTPAEGMIATKLSSMIKSDTDRFLPFLLLWFFAGTGGVIVHGVLRPGQKDLDAFMIMGGGLWWAVLLFEAWRTDRRQKRRDREAADLAAKGGGETVDDSWRVEA